jgi:hypothetical protein
MAWLRDTRIDAALVLGLAATALAACGGSSEPPTQQPPSASSGKLQAASEPGGLVAQARALILARGPLLEARTFAPVPTSLPATANTSTGTGEAAGAASDAFSQTTRQEEGVDEDDLVKTDGRTLYSYGGVLNTAPTLQAHRRNADGSLTAIGSMTLPAAAAIPAASTPPPPSSTGATTGSASLAVPVGPSSYQRMEGLMLASGAKKLASFRQVYSYEPFVCQSDMACPAIAYGFSASTIALDLVSTRDDGSLRASTKVQIQGDVVSTRMVGTTLYLVSQHVPRLAAELAGTAAERDAALASLTASDLLPTYRVNDGDKQALVQETQCYAQPGNTSRSLVVTTITAMDMAASNFTPVSRCFLGGAEAVYATPTSVYFATSRWPEPTFDAQGRWVFSGDTQLRTDLHKFAISGTNITYRASGAVVGHLGWDRERSPYRLSEHAGDLRVITYTGAQGWFAPADATNRDAPAPSPATLTVLRENAADQTLTTVATLPNAQRPAAIGKPNEQVYGVRFAGERAYVVTFRRTDPLYVLDLSNPADPKQAGALEVTGFSDSLYPLANGLLLGVGREADANGFVQSVKVALFDVANPQQPSEVKSLTFGGRGSFTALDFSSQGISFLNDGAKVRVALPMALSPNNGSFSSPTVSMQKMEVDTTSRSLSLLTPMARGVPVDPNDYGNVQYDRGVHIGANLYYYGAGMWSVGAW